MATVVRRVMPDPASNRGVLASPAVDDDVDALDRERRLGDVGGQHDSPPTGRGRPQCGVLLLERHGAGQPANVDAALRQVAERTGDAVDLGDPGQEDEHVTRLLSQRRAHGRDDRRFQPVLAAAGQPAHVDGVRGAGRRDDRCGACVRGQQAGEASGLGGRRHREDAQIRAPARCRVDRQGQPDVRREVAFVDLVEHHGGDAGQLRRLLQPTRQHPLGHHLDPGVPPDAPLVPRLVAHELADRRARQVGHPGRHGAGGQPAGLQHDEPPVGAGPWLGEQLQRHDGRLAGSGRRRHDGPAVGGQRVGERWQHLDDREVRRRHVVAASAVSRRPPSRGTARGPR